MNSFMLEQARRYSTGHTQLIVSALRGFLLQSQTIATDLAQYVPAPARRQLAGWPTPHQGAHLLRPSLATRLLRTGASLAQIGELLGHCTLDTPRIYAKVDERTLGTLALPWPGGEG
jgi:site-specific recombinase XerD